MRIATVIGIVKEKGNVIVIVKGKVVDVTLNVNEKGIVNVNAERNEGNQHIAVQDIKDHQHYSGTCAMTPMVFFVLCKD